MIAQQKTTRTLGWERTSILSKQKPFSFYYRSKIKIVLPSMEVYEKTF